MYNPEIFARLQTKFNIIQPPAQDLSRAAFISNLKNRTWGDFSAIMKPFWSSGSQMHPWDRELIDLLPSSMKVMSGAGAGYDWVDDGALAERGKSINLFLPRLFSIFGPQSHSHVPSSNYSKANVESVR